MDACADLYVHYMTKAQTPKAMILEEILEATYDPEQKQVNPCVQNNQLHKLLKAYRLISHELRIKTPDIWHREDRIVLHTKLRQKAISPAHEDLLGMVRCKRRLRYKRC